MARPIDKDQAMLDAILQEDFSSFQRKSFETVDRSTVFKPNWHVDAIAWHLQQCVTRDIKRLVITMPPRYMKTISASVALPAWILGRNPAEKILNISYSQDLSSRFASGFRTVVKSPWYGQVFPDMNIAKDTEQEVVTSQNGYRIATSVGGTLMGLGGNFIIIDDPLKPEEAYSEKAREKVIDWYRSTLCSRLDDKVDGVMVLVMQRLHLEDLAGYILENENWIHLNLPAIATNSQVVPMGPGGTHVRRKGEILHPEREPKKELYKRKVAQGSLTFEAQYQQNPLPEFGHLVNWAWFNEYDALPEKKEIGRIVQSWDTATDKGELNDYSVCITAYVEKEEVYLIDVFRKKLDYPSLKKKYIAQARKFKADTVVVESSVTGKALIQELTAENHTGVRKPEAFFPKGDKVMRMSAQSSKLEAGHVFVPREAAWRDEFRKELLLFPRARYDDQVDALSQLLKWMDNRNHSSNVSLVAPEIIYAAEPDYDYYYGFGY